MMRLRVAAAAFAILLMASCSRTGKNTWADANAILITVDTLRADHLPAYGYGSVRTPAIDRLAADSVLFRQDIAQVPLTLPSHCSLMTGLWPSATGVRDQAGFTLAAGTPTIASVLKTVGLQTAAFPGSTIVNAETGLAQGFDVYVNVSPAAGGSPNREGLERRGDQVMADALRWIEAPGRGRFFAWIHLFDPHTPYASPEPYRTQYAAAPYDGEIAFVDSVIGRLTGALAAKGLYDRTLIVFTSDHGEGLGEHGESAHGMFVYDATVRVPLIVKFPGLRWKGRSVTEQVRGIDVAPTILSALGAAIPSRMQGRDLVCRAAGECRDAAPPAYSETWYPYYHFGWSPLTAIRTGEYKYIRAPKPELYELPRDPREQNNVAGGNQAVSSQLQAQLAREYPDAPRGEAKSAALDAGTLAKLKSLGYIGSGSPKRSGPLPDPKDKIGVYTLLETALREAEQGRVRESNTHLREVLRQDDGLVDAHLNLGVNLAQAGETAAAMESFRRALSLDPRNVIATYNLAYAYARLGKMGQAVAGFSRTLELDPRQSQARVDLGRAYEMQDDTDAAIECFKRVIAEEPGSGEAHYYLARAYARRGMQDAARAELAAAQRLGFQPPER